MKKLLIVLLVMLAALVGTVLADVPTLIISPTTEFTVLEGNVIGFGIGATDLDMNPVAFNVISTDPASIPGCSAYNNFCLRTTSNTWVPTSSTWLTRFQWQTQPGDAGDYQFKFQALDLDDFLYSQSLIATIHVQANTVPVITSSPVTTAAVGIIYTYNVDATDANSDALTYSLTTAPSGMTINAATGVISWTPTNSQGGSHDIVVRVQDTRGGQATQAFTISVITPLITSTPITTAAVGASYTYDVDATDATSSDPLIYSLTTAPSGMSIDAATGVISWTPTSSQEGAWNVVVLVGNVRGGQTTQSFIITVGVNQPPTITSTPGLTATVGLQYIYTIIAGDPENQALTYSAVPLIVDSPALEQGMFFNPATGVFTWTPTSSQEGLHTVTLRVTDPMGNTDDQLFTITVITVINQPPIITSAPGLTAIVGLQYTYTVTAVDPENQALTYSMVSPLIAGMSFNPATGVFTWTPTSSQEGIHTVTLRVTDDVGNTHDQTFQLNVVSDIAQYRDQFTNYTNLFDDYDSDFSSIQDDVDSACDDYHQAVNESNSRDKRDAERDLDDRDNDLDDLESNVNDLEDNLKSLKRVVRNLPSSSAANNLVDDIDSAIQDDVNGLQNDIGAEHEKIKNFCVAVPVPQPPLSVLPPQIPTPVATSNVQKEQTIVMTTTAPTQLPSAVPSLVPNQVLGSKTQTNYTLLAVLASLGLLLLVLLGVMVVVLAKR